MGCVLCEHCTGMCCKYIALPLDEPETRRDFDDIRWYLMHEDILVFVDDGDWYFQVNRTCQHLQPDNRCGIYETRPQICREYTTADCDYHGGDYDYDHLFTKPEQIEAYAKEHLRKKRSRPAASGKKSAGKGGRRKPKLRQAS